MKLMKKKLTKIITQTLLYSIFVLWFFSTQNFVQTVRADLLSSSFETAKKDWAVLDMTWEEVLWIEDSLLVKFTKFFLKLTAALWVSVVIFLWIQYILAVWDESKFKKVQNSLTYVLVWIWLSLFSMTLIVLLNSFTKTNLKSNEVDNEVLEIDKNNSRETSTAVKDHFKEKNGNITSNAMWVVWGVVWAAASVHSLVKTVEDGGPWAVGVWLWAAAIGIWLWSAALGY